MKIVLRRGTAEDATPCGVICYEAFAAIATKHGFPPDFPNPETAVAALTGMLALPGVYSVVADVDGKPMGSNFLWELDDIAGIGPITVDPTIQNGAVGRRLMADVLARAESKAFVGVRLVQAAYHNRSLSLYTKLGFEVREPLSIMQGAPIGKKIAGRRVRAATAADRSACDALCRRVHGHDRSHELEGMIAQRTATVVEQAGAITGYATDVGFFGHAVAASNTDLMALIAAAPHFSGLGFLLPSRNAEVFRWCLASGLRVVQPMTLMSRGMYQEPRGAFLPSILF